MMLRDDLITLRAPEPADIEAMYRWENDPEMWDTGDSSAPMSRHLLERFVYEYDANIATTRQLRLIVVHNLSGETVGSVDLFGYDTLNSRCGVGIIIDEKWRRQGIGKRTVMLVAEYCHKRLGLNQLWCTVSLSNIASLALFDGLGFRRAGTLMCWSRSSAAGFSDMVIFQKLL